MTRRANPKPRWLRYEGKNGYVNERADIKAERLAAHCLAVKEQQAAGMESQAKRNSLPVRKRKKAAVAPDITHFGPTRRRPGRKARRTTPAKALYRPDRRAANLYSYGPRRQSFKNYMKPTYAGVSAGLL